MKGDYTCIVCGKEKRVLIKVELKDDEMEIFHRHKGVCQDCLKTADIEKTCDNFAKEQIEEQIKKSEDGAKHWKEELKKLK